MLVNTYYYRLLIDRFSICKMEINLQKLNARFVYVVYIKKRPSLHQKMRIYLHFNPFGWSQNHYKVRHIWHRCQAWNLGYICKMSSYWLMVKHGRSTSFEKQWNFPDKTRWPWPRRNKVRDWSTAYMWPFWIINYRPSDAEQLRSQWQVSDSTGHRGRSSWVCVMAACHAACLRTIGSYSIVTSLNFAALGPCLFRKCSIMSILLRDSSNRQKQTVDSQQSVLKERRSVILPLFWLPFFTCNWFEAYNFNLAIAKWMKLGN